MAVGKACHARQYSYSMCKKMEPLIALGHKRGSYFLVSAVPPLWQEEEEEREEEMKEGKRTEEQEQNQKNKKRGEEDHEKNKE